MTDLAQKIKECADLMNEQRIPEGDRKAFFPGPVREQIRAEFGGEWKASDEFDGCDELIGGNQGGVRIFTHGIFTHGRPA